MFPGNPFYGLKARQHVFSHWDEDGSAVAMCGAKFDLWWKVSKRRQRKLKRRLSRGSTDVWFCVQCTGAVGVVFRRRR